MTPKRALVTAETLQAATPTVHRDTVLDDLAETATPATVLVEEIPIGRIDANPYNPRQEFGEAEIGELAGLIQAQGFVGYLLARNMGARYQVAFGARRLLAAKQAGIATIPLRLVALTDEDMIGYALSENVARKDLTAAELAGGMKLLADRGWTQQAIAAKIGRSQQYVSAALRGLELQAADNSTELQAASNSTPKRGRPRNALAPIGTLPPSVLVSVDTAAELARVSDDIARREIIGRAARGETVTRADVRAVRQAERAAADPVGELQRAAATFVKALGAIEAAPAVYATQWPAVRDILTGAESAIGRCIELVKRAAKNGEH